MAGRSYKDHFGNAKLEDCVLITNDEYCKLKDPKFIGQTSLDKDNMFWMVWEVEGVLYKTHNKL